MASEEFRLLLSLLGDTARDLRDLARRGDFSSAEADNLLLDAERLLKLRSHLEEEVTNRENISEGSRKMALEFYEAIKDARRRLKDEREDPKLRLDELKSAIDPIAHHIYRAANGGSQTWP